MLYFIQNGEDQSAAMRNAENEDPRREKQAPRSRDGNKGQVGCYRIIQKARRAPKETGATGRDRKVNLGFLHSCGDHPVEFSSHGHISLTQPGTHQC